MPVAKTSSSASDSFEKKILSTAPMFFLILSHLIIMSNDTSRMYLPYMISSYVIAAVVYFIHPLPFREKSLKDLFFGKAVWLSRSAVNDYTLFIFNYVVFFNFLSYYASDWHFLNELIINTLGSLNIPKPENSQPGIAAAITYTIGLTLLGELTYYMTHRAYHEIPFLWELHKVHHSAEVMTPITFIRAHPIDLYIQSAVRLFSIAVASGIFMYFYPNKEGAIMVAGIDAGAFLYYIAGANLHHSGIWLSFGRPIEYIFISPAQHQIHHSANPKHFDKNYGSMLSVWDWIFGSLYIPEKHEEIKFGIGKDYKDYDSTFKLLWMPLREMTLIACGRKLTYKKTKSLKK